MWRILSWVFFLQLVSSMSTTRSYCTRKWKYRQIFDAPKKTSKIHKFEHFSDTVVLRDYQVPCQRYFPTRNLDSRIRYFAVPSSRINFTYSTSDNIPILCQVTMPSKERSPLASLYYKCVIRGE